MSASVSSTANSAAATTLSNISAWLSKAAAYSLNTSAEAANPSTPAATAADTVSFSPRAQSLFEALDVLNSTSSQDLHGSYSGQFGNASVSVTGGSGAQASAFSDNIWGNEITSLNVDAGSGVEDISTVNNSQSGGLALTDIILNSNNDTVNATSNGLIGVSGTTGNYDITTNTTGLGFAVVGAGSGNSTVHINGGGGGLAYGGSGNDTIYLDQQATQDDALAVAIGKSGTTTVIGTGTFNEAWGGSGTLTATSIQTFIAGSGTATVTFTGAGVDEAVFRSQYTSDTINLSNETIAAGTTLSGVNPWGSDRVHVSADANGNYAGNLLSYAETIPTEGQAGYGLAHANLEFQGYSESDFTSVLSGTTLTLENSSTGQSVTLNNYQAGLVTFSYGDANDNLIVSRAPPGLTSNSTVSSAKAPFVERFSLQR